jgi:uncharacterized damage-inducible protein DinB
MTIAEAFLAEFENEVKTTRTFLERLPEDKLTWKPHEKSKTAGELALHIAQTPGLIAQAAIEDEFALPGKGTPPPKSVREVLDTLDESARLVRKILPTFDDKKMAGNWRMTKDGQELLAMPRVALLRSIMLNHWYHHRGQFGVYLRLMGCKVPSSYGPSGDEQPDFMKAK